MVDLETADALASEKEHQMQIDWPVIGAMAMAAAIMGAAAWFSPAEVHDLDSIRQMYACSLSLEVPAPPCRR